MEAAEHESVVAWCRHLFNGILFPGSADADTRVRRLSLVLVLLLPAALLYPTRGFHLLEPDEGRYAQIPKEMLHSGSWVVPTLQGEPYLDKPPLMYWLVALSYKAFGITPEAARLVPALCVHLTILAVYLIGRRSVGERSAFWAAMLLSVAPGFVSVARLLLLDGLLVLCVTTSVLCGFEAVRTGTLKHGWWLAAAVASGLGFLTKGPISEVLLFVPLWAYGFLVRREEPTPPTPLPEGRGESEPVQLSREFGTQHASGSDSPLPSGRGVGGVGFFWYLAFFGVVFAVNLPWYVAIYFREPQFLKYFFWEHNVMRFLQPFDHLQPIWYYAPLLIGGLLPGTILLAAYFWNLIRGSAEDGANRSSAGGFWLLTGAWCVFFFSCSGSKLPTYILPAYPFLCLAVGEFVARTKWNAAFRTRALVGGMAAILLVGHHVAVPWYAQRAVAVRQAGVGGAVRRGSRRGGGVLPAELRLARVLPRPLRHAERAHQEREPTDDGLSPPPADGDPVHAPRLARGVQEHAAAEPGDRGDDHTQAEGQRVAAGQVRRFDAVGPVRRGRGGSEVPRAPEGRRGVKAKSLSADYTDDTDFKTGELSSEHSSSVLKSVSSV